MVKYELSENRKALKTRLGIWIELPDTPPLCIKADCNECMELDQCIGANSRELYCEVSKGAQNKINFDEVYD
jgi:hypothetical protein